jgi:citrate lyase subunit beta / citryl-CoA lyase
VTARRRSCLSVPGSSERMLVKAAGRGADEVVIDLEDAVAVAAKGTALATATTELARWAGGPVAVRVNAPRTPWCHVELAALAGLREHPDSVVLPKVESAADVQFAERLLAGAEAASGRHDGIGIQALVETAAGLARVHEIAASSQRLEALILGYADLGASLGGERELDTWLPAQHAIVLAARANGLRAIDGPHLGVAPDGRFAAAVARARELGFDGKWAIHPAQVDAINAAFTPTADELDRARAVIRALERADDGAIEVDDEMVDEAVRANALRVLAQAGGDPPGS